MFKKGKVTWPFCSLTYIRSRLQGGIYFFTVNLAERGQNDLLLRNIDTLLRKAAHV